MTIKKFVLKILSDRSNEHVKYKLGTLPAGVDHVIKESLGIDIEGYTHYLDNYGIRHSLINHGVLSNENNRGQIPVTIDDFELIRSIITTFDIVEDGGKNKIGRTVLIYKKKMEKGLYFYVEEVRSPRKKEAVIQTMYIRKRDS